MLRDIPSVTISALHRGRTVNARAGGIARMRPKRERLAQRAVLKARMMEMMAQGMTQAQMGKALRMSHGFTNKLYQEARPEFLAGFRNKAKEMALEHAFYLHTLFGVMARRALQSNFRVRQMKGDVVVMELPDYKVLVALSNSAVKISERLAKMFGTDAPPGWAWNVRPAVNAEALARIAIGEPRRRAVCPAHRSRG